MDKLPHGWRFEPISKVFKIASGNFLPKDQAALDGDFDVYGGNGVTGKHNHFNLSGENIIIGRVGAKCGNVRLVNENIWLTDNAFFISKYLIQINKQYLKIFLEYVDLGKTANQAAQPVISYKGINSIHVPIPPDNEQTRIVSKLDSLFARIDKSIALLEENIKHTQALMASVLEEVFREAEKNWKFKKLKLVTTKIGSGSTPLGGQSAYKESGISLIRSMNVYDSHFKKDGLAFIDEVQAKKLSNVTIEENDVLLNITGASVARCCVVDKSVLPARVNQHVSIIRTAGELSPYFLEAFLISPKTKNDLLFNSSGGATREAITKPMIENLEVPVPDPKIQIQILNYLHKIKDRNNKILSEQQSKLQHLKALKASLLDRAFKGEL